jgi:hypothetical protein
LAGTWLPAWCVPCYGWSTFWTFIMCLKKIWWVFLPSYNYSVYLHYIKLE